VCKGILAKSLYVLVLSSTLVLPFSLVICEFAIAFLLRLEHRFYGGHVKDSENGRSETMKKKCSQVQFSKETK